MSQSTFQGILIWDHYDLVWSLAEAWLLEVPSYPESLVFHSLTFLHDPDSRSEHPVLVLRMGLYLLLRGLRTTQRSKQQIVSSVKAFTGAWTTQPKVLRPLQSNPSVSNLAYKALSTQGTQLFPFWYFQFPRAPPFVSIPRLSWPGSDRLLHSQPILPMSCITSLMLLHIKKGKVPKAIQDC